LGESWFKASLDKKLRKPHINQWLGAVANACHSQFCREAKNKQTNKQTKKTKARPYLKKITNTKMAVRVAQVVEHLPSIH
jgi:hypothetical protein